MQFTSTLLVLAAAFMASSNALNIPRKAAPEPAGCTGGSFRDTNETVALAECNANCHDGCFDFQSGDYWFAICRCN